VDARAHDFQRTPLPQVAAGPWNLVLLRYSVAWCLDLRGLAAQLATVAAPGAYVLVTWVLPSRGAFVVSQLEQEAPDRLYGEQFLDDAFGAAGFYKAGAFAPAAPLWYPTRSWRWLLGLPVLLRPGPARGLRQAHGGRIFVLKG
jgi:hypothetical protein